MIKNMPKYDPIDDGENEKNSNISPADISLDITIGELDELAKKIGTTSSTNTTDSEDPGQKFLQIMGAIDNMLYQNDFEEEDDDDEPDTEEIKGKYVMNTDPIKYEYMPHKKYSRYELYSKLINDLDLDDDVDDIIDERNRVVEGLKIPMQKLKGIVPDSWLVMSWCLLTRCQPDDRYPFLYCHAMAEEPNRYTYFQFILYYNENDKLSYRAVRSNNILHEDLSPVALSEIYPNVKGDLNALSGRVSDEYYAEADDNMYENLFVGIESPLMSLHTLGTVNKSIISKKCNVDGKDLIYLGDVILNNNDDVKDFIHDFDLKPKDNKLELYAKVTHAPVITNNNLPKLKDRLDKEIDYDSDTIQNHMEINTINNIVFIEL